MWAPPAQCPLVECGEQAVGLEAETNEKKKGGWEGKKNSIFVKREKDLVENFYWGFLNLKKKNTKKDKKKKENILAGYVYQLGQGWGGGAQGAGLRGRQPTGPHREITTQTLTPRGRTDRRRQTQRHAPDTLRDWLAKLRHVDRDKQKETEVGAMSMWTQTTDVGTRIHPPVHVHT